MIRVFARKTSYSPTDEQAFFGPPPFDLPEGEKVHVSCVFTWDKRRAEFLAEQWGVYYKNVEVGGPAYDAIGGEFVPGQYIRYGEVITSRGCLNKCPYCFVPKREGALRLLPIRDGWDVLDNNLLACPKEHIVNVVDMLSQQKHRAMFRGGLDARLIDDWFIRQLGRLRIQCLFTAYDRPGDVPYVARAVASLRASGLTQRQIGCYVLVGYQDDTPEKAVKRLRWVKEIGAMPFAMYYRDTGDDGGTPPPEWQKIVRPYSRPSAIFSPKDYEQDVENMPLFTEARRPE